ncbi:MAG: AMP-binding protein [Rhodothermales bacterium]|nr:AMP-binding protein [Rhodothermales bacterium]
MLLSSDLLERRAAFAAYALDRAGVHGGDRVAILGGPSAATVAALVGAWRLGAVAVPLDAREPASALAPKLAAVRPRLVLANAPLPPGMLPPGATALPLPEVGEAPFLPDAMPDVAPALIVFTSGSTGPPKAAVLAHGALRTSARGVATRMGFGPASAWLLALPLHHVGGVGVVVRALEARAALVLPETNDLAAMLGDPAVTHASLVGTQLYRLLDAATRGEGVPGLETKALLLGGSALAPSLLDAAHARGLRVATSYGLTEMASTVTATTPGASRDALATSGSLLDGRDLRITPAGEIAVRGRTRFDGYVDGVYAGPHALRTPFDEDGWFFTGDLGHLDDAGRLVVTGRRDLMFVSGGENVHPEAIERALLSLPGVVQAIVVPAYDVEFGRRAVAFVETSDGSDPSPLRDVLRERLPRHLVPKAVRPLPFATGFKPSRAALARHVENEPL